MVTEEGLTAVRGGANSSTRRGLQQYVEGLAAVRGGVHDNASVEVPRPRDKSYQLIIALRLLVYLAINAH